MSGQLWEHISPLSRIAMHMMHWWLEVKEVRRRQNTAQYSEFLLNTDSCGIFPYPANSNEE